MERENNWLIPGVILAVFAATAAIMVMTVTGYPARPSRIPALATSIMVTTIVMAWRFFSYLLAMWRAGEPHPIFKIRAASLPAIREYVPVIAGIAIIVAFLFSITFLKSMIPALVPFWADAPFRATDRAIFLNSQAIAVSIKSTLDMLGYFYALWHVVHLGGILWVLHWRRGDKARHILSFMLTWSIGMALAYVFSSAGPIFTGEYDPAVAPASVRKAAELLWTNYQSEGALIGGGISAFPSMHVAIATWFALVLKDRGVPFIGAAYIIGIFLCSIILGWHYAIDGVAGIAVALVADRLSQAWLRHGKVALAPIAQPAPAPN